jgi:hypothetical protein
MKQNGTLRDRGSEMYRQAESSQRHPGAMRRALGAASRTFQCVQAQHTCSQQNGAQRIAAAAVAWARQNERRLVSTRKRPCRGF